MKELWLPDSETQVTVQDGKVTVWDTMKMTLRPVAKPTGFVELERDPRLDTGTPT